MSITIQDFKKLDLQVGTITHVADHPNADKLYLLTVNLGTEERTLVAGLKKHYTPAQLQGRQVVVVVNLEPAILRGVKSEGMLLAAQSDEGVSFLTSEKPIPDGSKIL